MNRDYSTRLRRITQTIRGMGVPPAVIDAVDDLTVLAANCLDRINELEKNQKCCKEESPATETTAFSAPKSQSVKAQERPTEKAKKRTSRKAKKKAPSGDA